MIPAAETGIRSAALSAGTGIGNQTGTLPATTGTARSSGETGNTGNTGSPENTGKAGPPGTVRSSGEVGNTGAPCNRRFCPAPGRETGQCDQSASLVETGQLDQPARHSDSGQRDNSACDPETGQHDQFARNARPPLSHRQSPDLSKIFFPGTCRERI